MPALPDLERYYHSKLTPMVTGANGGIGRDLVHRLAETPDGKTRPVIAFVRNSEKARGLFENTPGVIIAEGDLRDQESMHRAVSEHGVGIVFHVGGSLKLTDRQDNEENTVRASEKLLYVCSVNGVKKIVYTSSIATYGKQDPQREDGTTPTREDSPRRPRTPYGEGKVAVENMLLGQSDVDVSIIRPSDVIGPDMNHWTGDILHLMREFHIKPYMNRRTKFPYVDKQNLNDLYFLAAQKEVANGEIFTAVDGTITFQEIFQLYQDALRLTAFGIAVPFFLLKGLANATEFIARGTGKGIANVDKINFFVTGKSLTAEKAERVLGWTHRRTLADSIADVAAYEKEKQETARARQRE